MRRLVAAVALLALGAGALAVSQPQSGLSRAPGLRSTQIACGKERRQVKQLRDKDAKNVAFDNVLNSTVKRIGQLKRPAKSGPRQPKERRVYRIRVIFNSTPAQKLGYKIEENDSDIHLAVRDGSGATLVAEFPDPGCTSGARRRTAMKNARAALVAACHGEPPVGSFRELKGSARLTGVLFFDFAHHQRGRAPNVAELHPVLKVEDATCTKA